MCLCDLAFPVVVAILACKGMTISCEVIGRLTVEPPDHLLTLGNVCLFFLTTPPLLDCVMAGFPSDEV